MMSSELLGLKHRAQRAYEDLYNNLQTELATAKENDSIEVLSDCYMLLQATRYKLKKSEANTVLGLGIEEANAVKAEFYSDDIDEVQGGYNQGLITEIATLIYEGEQQVNSFIEETTTQIKEMLDSRRPEPNLDGIEFPIPLVMHDSNEKLLSQGEQMCLPLFP